MKNIDFESSMFFQSYLGLSYRRYIKPGPALLKGIMTYVTRFPVPILRYDQQFQCFSITVWLTMFGTLFFLGFTFQSIYKFYEAYFPSEIALRGPLRSKADFLILTLSTLTEPDPLPWFPKYSAGKKLTQYISEKSNFYQKCHEVKCFWNKKS